DFFISVHFKVDNVDKGWGVFVYMSTDKAIRASQWRLLEEEKLSWGDTWFLIGDWNDLCSMAEKKGGRVRSDFSFAHFNSFIQNMEMDEVSMVGYQFTWGNNRDAEGFVEEKLDRAYGSFEWFNTFLEASVLNIARSASDHSLILLNTGCKSENQKKK
ncbi:Unknown protein, partial [Striga hermonthica]